MQQHGCLEVFAIVPCGPAMALCHLKRVRAPGNNCGFEVSGSVLAAPGPDLEHFVRPDASRCSLHRRLNVIPLRIPELR